VSESLNSVDIIVQQTPPPPDDTLNGQDGRVSVCLLYFLCVLFTE